MRKRRLGFRALLLSTVFIAIVIFSEVPRNFILIIARRTITGRFCVWNGTGPLDPDGGRSNPQRECDYRKNRSDENSLHDIL